MPFLPSTSSRRRPHIESCRADAVCRPSVGLCHRPQSASTPALLRRCRSHPTGSARLRADADNVDPESHWIHSTSCRLCLSSHQLYWPPLVLDYLARCDSRWPTVTPLRLQASSGPSTHLCADPFARGWPSCSSTGWPSPSQAARPNSAPAQQTRF
jgi:hypothetical protein